MLGAFQPSLRFDKRLVTHAHSVAGAAVNDVEYESVVHLRTRSKTTAHQRCWENSSSPPILKHAAEAYFSRLPPWKN